MEISINYTKTRDNKWDSELLGLPTLSEETAKSNDITQRKARKTREKPCFFCQHVIKCIYTYQAILEVAMHIEKYQSNGKEYLRLVRTIRVKAEDGKALNRKAVVKALGPLSRYDDGKADYMLRLRQSFSEGNPLIPELLPYVSEAPKIKYPIEIEQGSPYCIATPKRFAPCLLDAVFSALSLDQLFASIKHGKKIEYDLQGIVRLLTYGRILEPASKIATMRQNEEYYTPLVTSDNDIKVYNALDIIYEYRKQIIRRMNTCISRGIGRNSSTVFYDVTNFFFEIEEPDEDIVDEDGNVTQKGLRKMGVSKENRKQPIV